VEDVQAGNGQGEQDFDTFQMVGSVRKMGLRVTPINAVRDTPYGVSLNTLEPPFNNPVAREAMYYATNPAPISQHVTAGYGRPAQAPTGPSSLYYEAKVPGYRTYNLAKAKALVKQLGGLSFTLLAIGSTDVTEMAEALQSEWAQAGIKAQLSIEPFEKLDETLMSHNWQANMGLAGGFDPALSALQMDFSSSSPSSGVHDPTLDKLIAQGAETVGSAAQTKLYHQIWKYLSDKAYFPFLFDLPYFNMTVKSVTGPGLTSNGFQVLWQDVRVR
jgi:peptide/nickel transport system substrate-binding protein